MVTETCIHKDWVLAIRCMVEGWDQGWVRWAEVGCIQRLTIRCLRGRGKEVRGTIHRHLQEAGTILLGRVWEVILVVLGWVVGRLGDHREGDRQTRSVVSGMETSYELV